MITPIDTDERERLKGLSSTTSDTIAYNLKKGNLQFFFDHWPEYDNEAALIDSSDMRSVPSYDQILDDCFAHIGKPMGIPTKYLRALFFYLEGIDHLRQAKFESFLGHRGIFLRRSVRWSGGVTTGLPGVIWRATPELIAEWQQERARRAQAQPIPTRRLKAV